MQLKHWKKTAAEMTPNDHFEHAALWVQNKIDVCNSKRHRQWCKDNDYVHDDVNCLENLQRLFLKHHNEADGSDTLPEYIILYPDARENYDNPYTIEVKPILSGLELARFIQPGKKWNRRETDSWCIEFGTIHAKLFGGKDSKYALYETWHNVYDGESSDDEDEGEDEDEDEDKDEGEEEDEEEDDEQE